MEIECVFEKRNKFREKRKNTVRERKETLTEIKSRCKDGKRVRNEYRHCMQTHQYMGMSQLLWLPF